jgi:hypothetical protein
VLEGSEDLAANKGRYLRERAAHTESLQVAAAVRETKTCAYGERHLSARILGSRLNDAEPKDCVACTGAIHFVEVIKEESAHFLNVDVMAVNGAPDEMQPSVLVDCVQRSQQPQGVAVCRRAVMERLQISDDPLVAGKQ